MSLLALAAQAGAEELEAGLRKFSSLPPSRQREVLQQALALIEEPLRELLENPELRKTFATLAAIFQQPQISQSLLEQDPPKPDRFEPSDEWKESVALKSPEVPKPPTPRPNLQTRLASLAADLADMRRSFTRRTGTTVGN